MQSRLRTLVNIYLSRFGFVERFGLDFYKLRKHVRDIFQKNRYKIIILKNVKKKSLLRVYQFCGFL